MTYRNERVLLKGVLSNRMPVCTLAMPLFVMAVVCCACTAQAGDGTWNTANAGNWSTAGNWLSSLIADGQSATANLMYNITADRTITIDGASASRTLGILNIGDSTTSSHTFTLDASGGGTLTFDNNVANAQLNQVSTSFGDIISVPLLLKGPLDLANASPKTLTLSGGITSGASSGSQPLSNLGAAVGVVTISGAIGDGSSGGSIAVVQNSANSALTLSGANTYSGGTTVKAGTLRITGDNLPVAGTLIVGGGGATLDLADGIARTHTVAGLTLTNAALVKLDWAGTPSADQLSTAAAATMSGTVALFPAGSFASGSPYTFLTAGSGLDDATYVVANNTNYSAAIAVTATAVTLTPTTATALTTAYWKGSLVTGALNAMAYSDGTKGNWTTDSGGTITTPLVPGATTTVKFYSSSEKSSTIVLGADMTVYSLVSDLKMAVTINADGHSLTILGGGINYGATPRAVTINADVILGANQAWNSFASNPIRVDGVISGPYKITQGGTGSSSITLTAANTFSGGLQNNKGMLTLKNQYALQNSTLTMNASTGSLIFDSSVTGKAFTLGGLAASTAGTGYNIALQNNAATPLPVALTVGGNDSSTTYAALLSAGGSLTKVGAGMLTLSNTNKYTGATTVLAGTLVMTNAVESTSWSVAAGSTLTVNGEVNLVTPKVRTLQIATGSGVAGRLSVVGNLTLGNGSLTVTAATDVAAAVQLAECVGGTIQDDVTTLVASLPAGALLEKRSGDTQLWLVPRPKGTMVMIF